MQYHYVYIIKEKDTSLLYIGVRTTKETNLLKDLKKYGTSSRKKEEILKSPGSYLYRILKIFKTRGEAEDYETFLHKKYDVAKNPKFWNISNNPCQSFNNVGNTTVLDLQERRFKSIPVEEYHSNKERYKTPATKEFIDFKKEKNPDYEFPQTRKLPVIYDKIFNKTFRGPPEILRDNSRYILFASKECEEFIRKNFDKDYIRVKGGKSNKGKCTVYDKIKKENTKISSECYNNNKDRYLNFSSKEYRNLKGLPPLKKFVTAFDKVELKFKAISKEEYYSNKEKYCNVNSKEYKIIKERIKNENLK